MRISGRIVLAMLFVAILFPPTSGAAPKKVYQYGMFLDWGSSQTSQVKTIMQEIVKLTGKRLGVPLQLNYFSKREAINAQMAAGKLDLVYTSDMPPPKNYREIAGLKIYGRTMVRNCFFSHKSLPYKTWKDLNSKKLMTHRMPGFFYTLRHLIGQPVLNFSKQLQVSKSSLSPFYALSLNQIDGAFASEIEFVHLKATSPGAVKDIKMLGCSSIQIPFPSLLVHQSVSPAFGQKVAQIMKNINKDPLFKDFFPLFQKAGLAFIPHNPGGIKEFNNLLLKGKKEGWEKEYILWRNLTGVE